MANDKQPQMKLHISYNGKENAIEMAMFDGDEGAIILLSKEQAKILIEQTDQAIQEFEKNKLN